MTSQIDIEYDLYVKTGGSPPFLPVEDLEHKKLETALRKSDMLPLVDSFGDVTEQIAVLHAHVQSVPFEFAELGHVIAFDHKADTRWDSTSGHWVRVIAGGAIHYPVIEEGVSPEDADLYLGVKTANSQGQGDDVVV